MENLSVEPHLQPVFQNRCQWVQ